eukprot:302795_1
MSTPLQTTTDNSNNVDTITQLLHKAKSQLCEIIGQYKNGISVSTFQVIDCNKNQKQEQFDALQIARDQTLNHFIILSSDEEQDRPMNYTLYQCTQCNQSFQRKWRLDTHIQTVHNKDRVYQSNIRKHNFKKHSNIHECKYCDQKFPAKSMLISHTRSHTKERPFQCFHCHKMFALKANLLNHLDQCTLHKEVNTNYYEFPKNASMNHQLYIQPIKQQNNYGTHWYPCGQCSESFQYENDYQTHQIHVHACWTSFKCIKCNKLFTRRCNLHIHQTNIHEWD